MIIVLPVNNGKKNKNKKNQIEIINKNYNNYNKLMNKIYNKIKKKNNNH